MACAHTLQVDKVAMKKVQVLGFLFHATPHHSRWVLFPRVCVSVCLCVCTSVFSWIINMFWKFEKKIEITVMILLFQLLQSIN